MRILWLLGLTTGCGYISDAKYDLRLDPDQDGVSIEEDCDNDDPNLGLKRTFYADTDGDGFGNPDELIEACVLPEGASENALGRFYVVLHADLARVALNRASRARVVTSKSQFLKTTQKTLRREIIKT